MRITRTNGLHHEKNTNSLLFPVLDSGRTRIIRLQLPSGITTSVGMVNGFFESIVKDPHSGQMLLSGESGVIIADEVGNELWRDPKGRFDTGYPEFSADGKLVLIRTSPAYNWTVRYADSGEKAALPFSLKNQAILRFSPSGQFVAWMDEDYRLNVRDRAAMREIVVTGMNDAFSFEINQRWLAIALPNNRMMLIDLQHSYQQREFELKAPVNRDPIPSPDNRYILLLGPSGLRVLDTIEHGSSMETSLFIGTQIDVAAFNEDASMIAFGGDDRYGRVIDRVRGYCIVESRFSAPVVFTTFSSDGRWAAFGAQDGAVRVFELSSGRVWADIESNLDSVVKLDFVGANEWIAVTGLRGVSIYRLDPFTALCQRQGRRLTIAEWRAVGGTGDPPTTCSNWR